MLAAPQPLRDVAALILETGMRPSEIFSLPRKNVFIDQGFLKIENSKTKSSNRKIWLSSKAAAIITARLEKFKGEFLFPQNDEDGNPPIYQLQHLHEQTLNRVKLKFRLYDCRHTFATRALESGIDLLTRAHLLGYANLNEVMRYAHPSEERKITAIRQMEKQESKRKMKAV